MIQSGYWKMTCILGARGYPEAESDVSVELSGGPPQQVSAWMKDTGRLKDFVKFIYVLQNEKSPGSFICVCTFGPLSQLQYMTGELRLQQGNHIAVLGMYWKKGFGSCFGIEIIPHNGNESVSDVTKEIRVYVSSTLLVCSHQQLSKAVIAFTTPNQKTWGQGKRK